MCQNCDGEIALQEIFRWIVAFNHVKIGYYCKDTHKKPYACLQLHTTFRILDFNLNLSALK